MRLNFYDTRTGEDRRIQLVKEKAVNYETRQLSSPHLIVEMLNKTVSLNIMGEEHCHMVASDTRSRPLGVFFLSKGTVNMSPVGIREVYMRALLIGAAHIILCHNHPSGDPSPSMEDILLTEKLKEAGNLLEIPLMDHIIVGRDSFYSFREHEML